MMLFVTDSKGWPLRLVSENHKGPTPVGHVAFDNLRAMVDWQEAHPEIKPPAPEPEEEPVPEEVFGWALREVCRDRGHEEEIEEKLALLPEPTRSNATARWKEKLTISRPSPYIVAMQKLLGWSDAYVDELFRAAGRLS